tara:strand:- start:2053 stop:2919 length:867 start_codon:yes stop_codon:yes gene_type:complete
MVNGGILLCGGYGTRLLPTTKYINKHLIPIYDKPMVYYSLSILLLSGIKDITIICNAEEEEVFFELLGTGEEFGVSFNYVKQDSPLGIPQAIDLALDNANYQKSLTVLGDNFIFGEKFFTNLENIFDNTKQVSIFSQNVKNPEEFGIVEVDENNNVLNLIEKPKEYVSSKAVIGLYVFNDQFKDYYSKTEKSERGEYEILDVVNNYGKKSITHNTIGRGTAWFDMGTTNSFYKCSSFVKMIQDEQGLLVCSPHEIAFRNEWIDMDHLSDYLDRIKGSEYSENLQYLMK